MGDAFCGGGSVPFEAARIGCDAYGSVLNPVAALLAWGALNIVGGEAVAAQVREAQQRVFTAMDRQVTDWRIEHNAVGWRADAYLYCTETHCPECGWRVPLAPSWVIGEKTHTIARLVPSPPPLVGGGWGEGEGRCGPRDASAQDGPVAPPPQPSPTRGEGALAVEIRQGVSAADLDAARIDTVRNSRLECPHCGQSFPHGRHPRRPPRPGRRRLRTTPVG